MADPTPISPIHRTSTFPHRTSPAVSTQTPLINTDTPAINAGAPVELPADEVASTPPGQQEVVGRKVVEEEVMKMRLQDQGVIVDVGKEGLSAEEVRAASARREKPQ
jgi:hypothetical protein